MLTCHNLRTERLTNPRGIDTLTPELTWTLESDIDGDQQTAYTVEVDAVPAIGDPRRVWRSGKLAGRIGDSVRYGGEPLASRQSYRWRVCVTDKDGADGLWSEWATFEMAVLSPDRIAASWIAGDGALRREFAVSSGLVRARAYVSGLGYYEFYCNGAKVSASALAPSFTEFDKRVEYETIDLTDALGGGTNTIGFLVGDGWWRHGAGVRDRDLMAICEITLEYADGRVEAISTDQSWQTSEGPLRLDLSDSPHQIFDGVAVDLARNATLWSDSSVGWRPARIATSDGVGGLVPTLLQPVNVVDKLRAQSVERISPTTLAIDFGQNVTGVVKATATGKAGDRVVVRHAELRDASGRLNTGTLRTAKEIDTYVLSGGKDSLTPPFVYHGFRYAEIEGAVDSVDSSTIEAAVMHTDLPVIGTVTTSDPKINWLLDALKWTVRANAFSVMTDVCQRDERRGWLMDGFTGLKAGMLFYDMNALGRKWVQDMIDNQLPDGVLRGDCAPMWGPNHSVGWQRALILVPVALYEAYGDTGTLHHALPHMRRYADHLLAQLSDDLIPATYSTHPAEWLSIGRQNKQLADNAMTCDLLRKFATALNGVGEPDADQYVAAADRIAAAFHKRWYDSNCAAYDAGESFAQASQVYALRFGMTPAELRNDVFDRLVDDLMNARGDGPFVTTGIGSTEHLPFVLSEFDRDDIVWQWLQRDAYPGYGFMRQNGATAIWERWEKMEYHQMNAHNHTGLAGIATWLRQRLVGISTTPGTTPVIDLRPATHLPLESLTATLQTRWGTVGVAWRTDAGAKRLTVDVPPGCVANLHLNGKPVSVLAPGQTVVSVIL
ncbi:MAG TPA: family 78 glycoside hydrolase catalytic domain [Capsulimonadaceae bacterium]|jgi:alpha-L-rhamnosidase